jgi:hypothetical protein
LTSPLTPTAAFCGAYRSRNSNCVNFQFEDSPNDLIILAEREVASQAHGGDEPLQGVEVYVQAS